MTSAASGQKRIITVSLNPAVDRVIEVLGFTPGAHQTGREVRRLAAGKGLNVAHVLSQFGVASIATGFLGEQNRAIFTAAMKAEGIADEFLTLPGRTRENITITDPIRRQDTHIRDVGIEVAPKDLAALANRLGALVRPDAIVIFTGSIAPGMMDADFAGLVDLCLTAGARVAVDTSGPALAVAASRPLWLIKPNRQELAGLVGGGTISELLAAARRLAKRIGVVLVTCGREGAYLVTSERTIHSRIELPASEIRSTVGCGDAFLGAFIAAIASDGNLDDALADAVACSAASACTPEPARFDSGKMAELTAKVEVREVGPA